MIEFCGIQVKLPIDIEVDNKGEIFLSKNPMFKRTKHVDTIYHFIQQYLQKNIVNINFVQTKDNNSEVFTKRSSELTFSDHIYTMVTPCVI